MKNHGNHQNRKFVSRDLLTVVLIFTGIMIFVVGIGLTRQISGSFERNSSEYLQSITRQSAENTAQQMKEAIGQIKMVADLVAEDGGRTIFCAKPLRTGCFQKSPQSMRTALYTAPAERRRARIRRLD